MCWQIGIDSNTATNTAANRRSYFANVAPVAFLANATNCLYAEIICCFGSETCEFLLRNINIFATKNCRESTAIAILYSPVGCRTCLPRNHSRSSSNIRSFKISWSYTIRTINNVSYRRHSCRTCEYCIAANIVYDVRTFTVVVTSNPYEVNCTTIDYRQCSRSRSTTTNSPSSENCTCHTIHYVDGSTIPAVAVAVGEFVAYFTHIASYKRN